LPEFQRVSPKEFDSVVKDRFVRDEHELLESRFFDQGGRIIAKVVRYLDDDGELLPAADLMVAINAGGN
jgi:hypothetical protein|tara:strand:+ start:922 stop:1128 length:207 start_codon:yes stop_codon:yes gene_type:complete